MKKKHRPLSDKHERYPEYVHGPFYVEKDYCITCRLPEHEAPDLMGFYETATDNHCFFKKQPATSDELDRAIAATIVCCCGALRYAGDDPVILQRLREAGLESQCDVLEDDRTV